MGSPGPVWRWLHKFQQRSSEFSILGAVTKIEYVALCTLSALYSESHETHYLGRQRASRWRRPKRPQRIDHVVTRERASEAGPRGQVHPVV